MTPKPEIDYLPRFVPIGQEIEGITLVSMNRICPDPCHPDSHHDEEGD
jgi:hypothetical protein